MLLRTDTTQDTPKLVVEVTPEGVFQSFLKDKTERTVRAYQKDLKDFSAFLKLEDTTKACAFLFAQKQREAHAVVLSYVHNLKERKLSAATINRRVAALKSLWSLGLVVGLVSFPLAIKGVKGEPYKDTQGPGSEGVRLMLDALKGREDAKAIRDRAILRLMFDLALRRGEVVSLNIEHLDLLRQTVAIHGKGRASRQKMTLPQPTREALEAWLKLRGDRRGGLFMRLDKNGEPRDRLSESGLYYVIQELGKQVGLEVRPHGLRHAAITEALDATNGDVRKVQRFSRHRDVRILIAYDDNRHDLAGEVSNLVSHKI